MAFTFDLKQWPLVFVSVETLDLAGVEGLMAEYVGVFARRERFVSILDSTGLRGIPNAKERQLIGKWTSDNAHHMKRWNLGAATVVTSAPARAALTGLSWLSRPASPQYYAPDLVDAYDWCAAQMAAAGLSPTPAMAELRSRWALDAQAG